MENVLKNKYLLLVLFVILLFSGVYFFRSNRKDTNQDNIVSLDNDKFNKAMYNAQIAFGQKDYAKSIASYEEALTYSESDKAYSGLYTVYSAQQNWEKVLESLDKAIAINPLNADYWIWKLFVLDEQFKNIRFGDLSMIYDEAMNKIDPRLRNNLTINFARIAESNKQINKAISLWQKAKELSPDQAQIYEDEIKRLRNI